MQSSSLLNRQEQRLAGERPVLISVSRSEVQLQRELDQGTAERRRIEERQRVVFGRERAVVRSRVDQQMQEMLHGVVGVVPPSVIEPPILPGRPPGVEPQDETQEGIRGNAAACGSSPPGALGKPTVLPCGQQQGKMYMSARDSKGATPQHVSPRKELDALPRGFPIPFEESGFQCAIHWAETSFQEVLLTALGPRSVREQHKGTEMPNRLLVSVACHLLNDVLIRESKYSILWPLLRQVIFEAVFTPSDLQSVENRDFSGLPFPCRSFKTCHDFVNVHLWSDAYIAERKENARLSQRVLDMQEVVRKSRLVLRLAQRRVDRISLEHTFHAWRTTTRRTRAFREALTTYILRIRKRIPVEGCFLRWRRIATRSHVSSLVKMLKESEIRVAFLENANSTAVDTLSKKLVEEQRNNEILKMKKEALKSQLAENHVLTLRAMHNELRQLQYNVITAKKNAKRWERIAKTYTCQTKMITVSSTVRKSGLALRRLEDDYAWRTVTIKDRTGEARQCLETFLLDWVNLFMRNSVGGVFWRTVSKIDTGLHDGDFGPPGLLKLVRTLESFYVTRGAKLMVYFPSPLRREADILTWKRGSTPVDPSDAMGETLFKELKHVLYLQTAEGLFPSLLTHCSFLSDFFSPGLFYKFPSPLAMLWVLSALFIGYVRTVGGGPVSADQDIYSQFRCRGEDKLGNYVVDLAPVKGGGGAEKSITSASHATRRESRAHVVANDTVIKKNTRTLARRRTFIRKLPNEGGDVDDSRDGEKIVDTLSDLEVYLGLDDAEDGSSTSSSRSSSRSSKSSSRSSSTKTGGNDNQIAGGNDREDVNSARGNTRGGGVSSDAHSNLQTPSTALRMIKNQMDEERRRRVQRKAHLIPPVSATLSQATLREYVQLQEAEKKQRRLWAGLARVVTSLILRFHILDSTPPSMPERKRTPSARKPVSLVPLPNTSANVSYRLGSAHGQRKSVRLLASSRSMDNSNRSTADKVPASVTLRKWLEDAKVMQEQWQ